jgi:hypothetical protein
VRANNEENLDFESLSTVCVCVCARGVCARVSLFFSFSVFDETALEMIAPAKTSKEA